MCRSQVLLLVMDKAFVPMPVQRVTPMVSPVMGPVPVAVLAVIDCFKQARLS